MSYTTYNRFDEPIHQYNPPKDGKGAYVPGTWWPDFGPASFDYSEQHKMHPTNTMFKNQMARPRERVNLMRDRVEGRERSVAMAEPMTQRDPGRQAMYQSVIIQPYRSGGRHDHGKERFGYQFAATREPHNMQKEMQAFNTHLAKTLSAPGLGATTTLPTSLVRLRQERDLGSAPSSPVASRSLSTMSNTSSMLPEWVASHTFASRPIDAAGHAGSTRNKHCMTNPDTGAATKSLTTGHATISMAAGVARGQRAKNWQELMRPGG